MQEGGRGSDEIGGRFEHRPERLDRVRRVEATQGCLYCKGAFEYDERPGEVRELLEDGIRRWRSSLKRTVIQAIDAGHLRPDTDADQ